MEDIHCSSVSKYLDGLDRKCNHDCLFCIERMEPNLVLKKYPIYYF